MVIRRKLKEPPFRQSLILSHGGIVSAAVWQSSLISVDVGKDQHAVPVVVEEVPQSLQVLGE